MKIVPLYRTDIEKLTERIHAKLDGKIMVPERLAVFLVGTLSAVVPIGLMLLWWWKRC